MKQRLCKPLVRLAHIFSQKPSVARISVFAAAVVVAGGVLIIALQVISGQTPLSGARRFSGSKQCINYAQKIEGKILNGVHELNCTLSPRTIGNSTLTAKYLTFSGKPSSPSVCLDPGAQLPPDPEAKYCVDFYGVILSDGHIVRGIGTPPIPIHSENYCHSYTDMEKNITSPPTYDLYFYKGSLYDRIVFRNTRLQTKFGTCILNGTRLTDPQYNCNDTGCTSETTLTNITVSYEGVPTSCSSSLSEEDFFDCVDLVTAATTSLTNACYVGPIVNNDCENVYVERMAELNRCQDVPDAFMKGQQESNTMREMCEQEVTQPGLGIVRIDGEI